MTSFTVERAREELARVLPVLTEIVAVRADAAEMALALNSEGPSTGLGGLPELKALQARMDELLSEIQASGVLLKGLAPLLLDFPGERDGVSVQYCWLEGDPELAWYHRSDLGFPGRRRL